MKLPQRNLLQIKLASTEKDSWKTPVPNSYGMALRTQSQSPKSQKSIITGTNPTMLDTHIDGTTTPISIINDQGSTMMGTDRPKSSSFRANFNTMIGQKALRRLMNETHLNYDEGKQGQTIGPQAETRIFG